MSEIDLPPMSTQTEDYSTEDKTKEYIIFMNEGHRLKD